MHEAKKIPRDEGSNPSPAGAPEAWRGEERSGARLRGGWMSGLAAAIGGGGG